MPDKTAFVSIDGKFFLWGILENHLKKEPKIRKKVIINYITKILPGQYASKV